MPFRPNIPNSGPDILFRVFNTLDNQDSFTIEQDDQIDYVDENNFSLLTYISCKNHSFALKKILLEHEKMLSNLLETENLMGNTPLMWSIANSSIDATLVLLDEGVVNNHPIMNEQINKQNDKFGNTPLILACAKGAAHHDTRVNSRPQIDAIDKLLTLEVDVNKQDNKGNTALHFAVLHSDFNLVELLIKKGALTDIINEKGLAPFDFLALQTDEQEKVIKFACDVYSLKYTPREQFTNKLTSSNLISLDIKNIIRKKTLIYYLNELKASQNLYDDINLRKLNNEIEKFIINIESPNYTTSNIQDLLNETIMFLNKLEANHDYKYPESLIKTIGQILINIFLLITGLFIVNKIFNDQIFFYNYQSEKKIIGEIKGKILEIKDEVLKIKL